jgi:hypothetical protein
MRRFVLWIAAILITFAIGVGADRLWWHFLAAPPQPAEPAPVTSNCGPPIRDIVYVPAPPAPPPPPKPTFVLDYDRNSFSMSAVFYIMGAKPAEFADIDSFEVMLGAMNEYDPTAISVYRRLGDDYDSAHATFGLVTARRLFFATDKMEKGDFEYRFEGEFLRKDFEAVEGKNKPVLRGTLTKMKNGRTVAQQEFTFRMEYMGC